MTGKSTPLAGSVRIRILRASDPELMCAAYLRNRDHLAPWEPLRAEEFFTVDGQMVAFSPSSPCSSPAPMFRGS